MQLLRDNHTLHVTLFTRAVPAHESLTIYTPHFKPVFLQLYMYLIQHYMVFVPLIFQ